MLKREQKKAFYGVILRVVLTVVALVTVFFGMFGYWWYFTSTDAVEFLGVYISLGSMINLIILAFADDNIKKFVAKERELIYLYSSKKGVKKLSNVA